ncbi:phage tail assembly chaperone [Anaeromassilibacillus senegalensis]|uniref:phage tail assembly chaperone n=1 Tax=Anaeromassilibacillus senegalensis TaxID=1673717 RepID=UPI0006826107|nr:phage tail assembly chaperone [Anaeromassilibacillus senegalensis]
MRITSLTPPPSSVEISGNTAIFCVDVTESSEINGSTGAAVTVWTYDQYTLPVRVIANTAAQIADDYDTWLQRAKAYERAQEADKVRAYRDKLLNDCDLIYCNPSNWAAMDEPAQAVWQEYKQALRDVPQQAGFPHSVTFPPLPAQDINTTGGDTMTLIMADGTQLSCTGVSSASQSYMGVYRSGVRIMFAALDYTDQELRAIFANSDKTRYMAITDAGKPLEGYTLFVRSTYEGGQVAVEMVKEISAREAQLMADAETQAAAVATILGAAPAEITPQLAAAARANIERLASYAPDEVAAQAPSLYPHWRPGEVVVPGDRRYFPPTGKLYKVRDGQGHTTQADWTPDVAQAIWEIIDVSHAGTQDDPIPAARGMEYIYGLYYSDPEDGKLYLCQRTGEAKGGKINLQYLPHELVGQYFTEVV